MATIRPLRNYVLVRRNVAKKSKGGILLPDSAQEKPREGVVISKGEGKRNEQGVLQPIEVEVGDTIVFGSYAGTEIGDTSASAKEEEKLLILSEDEILGVLTTK